MKKKYQEQTPSDPFYPALLPSDSIAMPRNFLY